jgi:hypothetical protein
MDRFLVTVPRVGDASLSMMKARSAGVVCSLASGSQQADGA